MHPFRKLLLISMGREASFEKAPSPKTWEHLFKTSVYQTLVGILNVGVHRLPSEQLPPEALLEKWDKLTEKVEKIYWQHERQVAELEGILRQKGLQGCLLKGTGLARLYPTPGRRQSGDIDVWVPGPRKAVLKAFSDDYGVHEVLYQECKVDIFDDTIVEVHFHPSKMSNPFLNARLQRWFRTHSPFTSSPAQPSAHPSAVASQDSPSEPPSPHPSAALVYPDAEFNAVFCMAHMYRHYIVGGLGLRQMMDYYYVLRELPAARRGPAMQTLKRLGMGRFAAAMMLALQYNFGLEDEYLLCEPDRKRGPKLINDTFRMGNFGVLDSRNRGHDRESALARFIRKNRRSFSNLRWYPREVLWAPFSRIAQYLWRRLHGFL